MSSSAVRGVEEADFRVVWLCVFGQLLTSPSLEEPEAEILDDHALPRELTVCRTRTVTASLMCTSRGSRGEGVVCDFRMHVNG